MGEDRSNAASERARWIYARVNDRDWFLTQGAQIFAADFKSVDRRRVINRPDFDAPDFIAAVFDFEEVAGSYPQMDLKEVLAIRGERLVAYRFAMRMEAAELETIDVARFDAAVERVELLVRFDSDDIDAAMAELDRLHDEIDRANHM